MKIIIEIGDLFLEEKEVELKHLFYDIKLNHTLASSEYITDNLDDLIRLNPDKEEDIKEVYKQFLENQINKCWNDIDLLCLQINPNFNKNFYLEEYKKYFNETKD